MKGLRYAVCAAAIAVSCAGMAWAHGGHHDKNAAKVESSAPASFEMGTFDMTDQNGEKVTNKDLQGRPSVIFFGYTYCPDICPATLGRMTDLMKKLGPDADKLNVVFVSVDPERDTPAHLKDYMTSFDKRITALTGTPDQAARMAKALYVYYKKVPVEGSDDYAMDHTASTYLFDARGNFKGTLDYEENPETALEKLRMLASKGA